MKKLYLIQFLSACFIFLSSAANVQYIIKTIAGNGTAGDTGDDSSAINCELHFPMQVCTDTIGNIYIVEQINNTIRRIDASTGIITTVAGTGVDTFTAAADTLATTCPLSSPGGICLDDSGNMYIADFGDNLVRKVSLSTGHISTIAGVIEIKRSSSGDGDSAIKAHFAGPLSVCVDHQGNVYISDYGAKRIRKVDAATGIINTVVVLGLAPTQIFLDDSGYLYASSASVVYKVNTKTGAASIVAGMYMKPGFSGDSGLATMAQLSSPDGIFADKAGNLYIADYGNSRIRKVDTAGIITTIIGTDSSGFSGDGSAAIDAQLTTPTGVWLDQRGSIYISDAGNERVRKASIPPSDNNVANVSTFNDLKVFPNPSSGKFTLQVDQAQKNGIIKVYNVGGSVVYRSAVTTQQIDIDISQQPQGIYFICLVSSAGTQTQKLIVH